MTAERLADMYKITREQSDAFSLRSNMRRRSRRVNASRKKFVPVKLPSDGQVVDVDQGPRAETTMEKLAGLEAFIQARWPGDRRATPLSYCPTARLPCC